MQKSITNSDWSTRLINYVSVGNSVMCVPSVTADTVLQVSVYDTINKDAQYSLKVRRLGEYHPGLAATKDQEGQDIGDPLYGNAGGVDELVSNHFCHICALSWTSHGSLMAVVHLQHQSKQA